ncbi:phospholipase [Kwoniella heveanensis CBS 569]|nr:phospholipase [Kwoniella heveanensis CBS 569]
MSVLPPDAPPPDTPPLLPIPVLDYRWVHAGAQHLDLLPTPITAASTSYKPFGQDESFRVEEAWRALPNDERRRIVHTWGSTEGEGAPARTKKKGKDVKETKENHKAASTSDRRASVVSTASTGNHPVDELRNDKADDSLAKEEHIRSGEEQAMTEEESSEAQERKYREIINKVQNAEDDYELITGVPVSQDSLFEVSLPTLSLHPVFWAHTGPRVPVLRGTWFVESETRPCSWELAEEIEKAYLEIQPWQPSYKQELATAMALGSAGEEKLKYNLPAKFGLGLGIIFEDGEKGRLITTGALTYLTRAFWASLRAKPSGTYVYRGFGPAAAASGRDKLDGSPGRSRTHSRRGSSSSQRSATVEKSPSIRHRALSRDRHTKDSKREKAETVVGQAVKGLSLSAEDTLDGVRKGLEGLKEGDKRKQPSKMSSDTRDALEEENAPLVDASEDDAPCTDLILVIHGIGQQLATQYEAYNFVYAGNQLRQVLRKQSNNPALASIIRDRRCQILPVQWRTSLNLGDEKTEEDREHGMDNRFTIADITINKSIPYVRELTNSVLLDIPLYMSHHRQKMIEAVCLQANKLYRLWIARNPEFEKHGRVHIIGHSLGSALAAQILSNQPTKMPSISQLPKQVLTQTRDRFVFNTSNLFLCGSPLGIFLHLEQAQLMPRKGRERTMYSPQDEALDRAGKYGCLAIDSLYNIFYYTDPVAYQLNAAVDARIAAQRQPLAITSVTAPFYAPVTDSFSTISKYLPSYLGGGTGGEKKPARPGVIRLPSGIEMSGPHGEERLEGSRGERRFSALNPHGNVDFFLPSAGVSEYLDMITAHLSYWTDPSFAAFLLAEIFSTRLDLMRTGMGLAQQVMPEGTA